MRERNGIVAGFALPTVMIASVVMMIILLSGLTATSSINASIRNGYVSKIADDVADSGVAMARACLEKADLVATWTDAKPLKPNTDCNGDVVSGAPAFVLDTSTIKASFEVPAPVLSAGIQNINATATVDRMKLSDPTGIPQHTVTTNANYNVIVPISFRKLTFGYSASGVLQGAQFGVVLPTGELLMVGYNDDGRLGDGTTTSRSTPVDFILPAGVKASRAFSNFLSIGYATYVVATDGDVYAAGSNGYGMLGVGSAAAEVHTPLKVVLPVGVDAKFVGSASRTMFVIGSDHNVYSAGQCDWGQLGSNYTLSGCSNRSSANVRVALPAVNLSDLNTLPVEDSDWVQATNLATDRLTTILRMQGGRVYTWGANDYGQIGNGTTAHTSVPVKVGTFGDVGQPKAIQVANDGMSFYAVDDNGDAWGWGSNEFGQLAGAGAGMENGTSGLCIRYSGSVGAQATLLACDDSFYTERLWWMPDKTLRIGTSDTTTHCLHTTGTGGTPITVQICDPNSPNQRWRYEDDNTIRNEITGCIATTAATATSGDGLLLRGCVPSNTTHTWWFQPALSPRKVQLPASAGNIVRLSTDNRSVLFLTDTGEVWGAGSGAKGILGVGSSFKEHNPAAVRYGTFSDAVDIYMTMADPSGLSAGADYNNAYVIRSDGSVYGTGANVFGQIGLGLNGSDVNITSAYEHTPRKMILPDGVRARNVQSGFGTTVILSTFGDVYTVGNNSDGQLGDGTTTNSSLPEARKYVNPFQPLIF